MLSCWVVPDLMAACRLPVKLKTQRLESTCSVAADEERFDEIGAGRASRKKFAPIYIAKEA